MEQKRKINWKNMLWQFRWLGLAIAIAVPAAIIGNYFVSKSELKTWTKDIPENIKHRDVLPWGPSLFEIKTEKLAEVSPSWASAVHAAVPLVNTELKEKFGLKPRLCPRWKMNCYKNPDFPQGPRAAEVIAAPAPKSWSEWTGITKKPNLCEPVSLRDEKAGGMGMLYPVVKDGYTYKFYLFICVEKWKNAMRLLNTPATQELKKYEKVQIARHELMHLFFHKHPAVGGGVTHQPPSYTGGMDGYGDRIFTKWILPSYQQVGLVSEQLIHPRYRKTKK